MSRGGLPARFAAAALGALLLGGCVYYNGMYNAKRLAGSARKAEREGRTFEANNLWGQVITRAESLVVRHPESKYVDEAMVLKGIALARLGQCSDAVRPLARASMAHLDGATGEEAAFALGHCRLQLGEPAAAALALSQLVESADPHRRRNARLYHARALRRMDRADEALLALDGLDGPRVVEERLLALGTSGRDAEALALADTLLAVNDSVPLWDSVVTIVGRASTRTASALVDQLDTRPNLPPEVRARRLYEDGVRLESTDSARARARLHQASRVGAGTEYGERAKLRLFRGRLGRTETPGELAALSDSLERLAVGPRSSAQESRLLLNAIAEVRAAADSSGPGIVQGDLRLFLAAETARDSLLAPRLASHLFRELVESWPESPYAPKALLAGGVLDPDWGEAARALLAERYAASPYLAFLRGEDPAGYRQLEDSLQSYAFDAAAAQRRATQDGDRRTGDGPSGAARPGGGGRAPGQQPRPRRGLEP